MSTQAKKLKIGAPQPVTKARPKPNKVSRPSAYKGLIDKLNRLTEGRAIKIDVPEDITVRTFMNRNGVALDYNTKRGILKAPEGCRFRQYQTDDGRVAFKCEKIVKVKVEAVKGGVRATITGVRGGGGGSGKQPKLLPGEKINFSKGKKSK